MLLARLGIAGLIIVMAISSCAIVDKADLEVSWEILMITVSINSSGEVSIGISPEAGLVTPIGKFAVGAVVDPGKVFKAEKVLIIRFNGKEEFFDLHGRDVEVRFGSAHYDSITVATRDGNVLVDIRSSSSSGYTVSGGAPPAATGSSSGSLSVRTGQKATIFTLARSTLNLRSSPTTNSSIITRLHSGLVVDVLAGPRTADGYTWWQIRTFEGAQGWVVEWLNGYQMLLPGIPPIPAAPPGSGGNVCGGKPYRFSVGQTVVVSARGDDLRLLNTHSGSNITALGLAVTGDRLRIDNGPACAWSARYQQDVIYWYVFSAKHGKSGWVADGITREDWLCPTSDPGCDR